MASPSETAPALVTPIIVINYSNTCASACTQAHACTPTHTHTHTHTDKDKSGSIIITITIIIIIMMVIKTLGCITLCSSK